MTQAEYASLTGEQFARKRWRTARPLLTPYQAIPAGTEVMVVGKGPGLLVEGVCCEKCGVKFRASRVPCEYVEEIKG